MDKRETEVPSEWDIYFEEPQLANKGLFAHTLWEHGLTILALEDNCNTILGDVFYERVFVYSVN